MRVLIASTANDGHYGPMVTLARACARAGHEVQVAAPASFTAAVTRSGFGHLPFDDAPGELVGPVMARLPTLPPGEADETVIREIFGRIDAQAAYPGVRAAIEAWRPDVVVREPGELGSLAAARSAGVPHVQVAVGMTETCRYIARLTAEPLAELAVLAGLPEDALTEAAAAEPVLSPVPELLDRAGDEAYVDGQVRLRYRDDAVAPAGTPLPAWGDPGLPLVYVTFGTVTGLLPPFAGVFRQALDGLADLPVRVLMTVGRQVEVAALGPVPANAHVEPWWPQADILAHADLVLGHGGFGTTLGALAAAVPQVVAPIFTSDQKINARHVAAAGAGRAVPAGADVVVRACAEVGPVLDDPSYREGARRVAAALADLPPASAAAALLVDLAG